MVTIDVGAWVAVSAAIMAALSGVALVGATRRGLSVFLGTTLAVAGVWLYWVGSYASIIAEWWR